MDDQKLDTSKIKERSPSEVLQELLTSSLKPLSEQVERLEGKLGELVEQANRPDEGEVEQRGFRQGLEAVAKGFESDQLEGEIQPIAHRILNAMIKAGYLKEQEAKTEVADKTEEKPEEPKVFEYVPVFHIGSPIKN